MTVSSTDQYGGRRAALRHLADVLRLCLTGRPRRGVLGYASFGQTGHARYAARWRTLPGAVARIAWPAPTAPTTTAHWTLTREDGGWAVRPADGSAVPTYFTTDIPADDQNAAFDWAGDVTPGVDRKRISYVGAPPQ